MGVQISGIATQVHLNKNQLQQLLLGIAFVLRDLDFACFADPEEILPTFLEKSCMKKEDALAIAAAVDKLSKAIFENIK